MPECTRRAFRVEPVSIPERTTGCTRPNPNWRLPPFRRRRPPPRRLCDQGLCRRTGREREPARRRRRLAPLDGGRHRQQRADHGAGCLGSVAAEFAENRPAQRPGEYHRPEARRAAQAARLIRRNAVAEGALSASTSNITGAAHSPTCPQNEERCGEPRRNASSCLFPAQAAAPKKPAEPEAVLQPGAGSLPTMQIGLPAGSPHRTTTRDCPISS